MPVDRDPSPDGNILLTVEHGRVRARVVTGQGDLLAELGQADAGLRTSHFATCPKANEHRKARGRRR